MAGSTASAGWVLPDRCAAPHAWNAGMQVAGQLWLCSHRRIATGCLQVCDSGDRKASGALDRDASGGRGAQQLRCTQLLCVLLLL